MRPYILTSALLLVSCAADPEPRPPPSTRLVYPSGVAFWRPPAGASTNGFLYVASANFDKCFDSGSLVALDLDAMGVRPFGTAFGADERFPQDITELGVPSQSYVQIESFAGEMALWLREDGAPRLFVPSRAEGNFLHAIDVGADGTTLACVQPGAERDCRTNALSLTDVPGASDGRPAAPSPLGVTVDPAEDRLWVTHSTLVGPEASETEADYQSYVVNLPAADPVRDSLSPENFIALGTNDQLAGAAHATAIGTRYVYASGRNTSTERLGALAARFVLRLVDKQNPGRIVDTGLQFDYAVREGRGLAVVTTSAPGAPVVNERVYLLARGPDTLLIVDVLDATSDSPIRRVVSAVPLPEGASELELIRRPGTGRGNLLAVTGSGDEAVSLFDEEVGQLVAQVQVGEQDPAQPSQPFGLAADVRDNAARLFATTFGDGRVAVIDIPNLDRPQDARLVARLGAQQLRDPRQGTSVCQETNP